MAGRSEPNLVAPADLSASCRVHTSCGKSQPPQDSGGWQCRRTKESEVATLCSNITIMTTPVHVFDRLIEIALLIQDDLARSLPEAGLTVARTHLLWEVHRSGPTTQQSLAAALKVTPAECHRPGRRLGDRWFRRAPAPSRGPPRHAGDPDRSGSSDDGGHGAGPAPHRRPAGGRPGRARPRRNSDTHLTSWPPGCTNWSDHRPRAGSHDDDTTTTPPETDPVAVRGVPAATGDHDGDPRLPEHLPVRVPPPRCRPARSGSATTSRSSPILIVLVSVSAIELIVVDVIVQRWPAVRIPLLILGVWGLVYMIGLLLGMLTRPHAVGPDGIRVRSGSEVDIPLAWDDVYSLTRRTRTTQEKQPKVTVDDAGNATLHVRMQDETNIEVGLERPIRVRLPHGTETVSGINLYADDPKAFMNEVRRYL